MNYKKVGSFIKLIEKKYITKLETNYPTRFNNIHIGDIVEIEFTNIEDKLRIYLYNGLVVAIKNKGLNKMLSLHQKIKNINIKHNIPYYSPKIKSIKKKSTIKIRHSKLYFIKTLKERYIKFI